MAVRGGELRPGHYTFSGVNIDTLHMHAYQLVCAHAHASCTCTPCTCTLTSWSVHTHALAQTCNYTYFCTRTCTCTCPLVQRPLKLHIFSRILHAPPQDGSCTLLADGTLCGRAQETSAVWSKPAVYSL